MKKKRILGLMGATAFMIGVFANLQYAWGDYGVTTNSLHAEVLAQSCSVSGGDGATTSGEMYYRKEPSKCVYSGKTEPFGLVILGNIQFYADGNGRWEYASSDSNVRCFINGQELCVPQNCPSVPSGSGSGS
ncbi:hypothetical protein [Parabacteroides sp. AM08-6]|uniref:hypothetical protein n=1 Tax=Parabacteroides sp. AM08-6 TaxID=2292053 RepID=UPI000EFF2DF6|nr:hypothetical protein [Parabacteroides sp. AM08-6]RHJ86551.1 hypothetical protein DW103_02460 [Parabacteroides sp. AM08-6]